MMDIQNKSLKCSFKLEGKNNINLKNIIQKEKNERIIFCNCNLTTYLISKTINFEIIKYLGGGTVGKVFLIKLLNIIEEEEEEININYFPFNCINPFKKIKNKNLINQSNINEKEKRENEINTINIYENENNLYILKISNIGCNDELYEELELIYENIINNNIKNENKPLFYGDFLNYYSFGIIYNFFGYYNLEKIKNISVLNERKITFNYYNNINIIKQLINQLKELKIVLHCDLKPSNVVLNNINNQNNLKATIIDFGLIRNINYINDNPIISTGYITSPESILTIDHYKKNICNNEIIDYSKSDYFGLYSIVCQLFLKKSYWKIINEYLYDYCNFSIYQIDSEYSYILYTYIWFKYSYNNINEIVSISLKNLINNLENKYFFFKRKIYLSYDEFFNLYILSNIENIYFENENYKIEDFKIYFLDFCKKIIAFEPNNRYSFNDLLKHPFLNL